MKGQFIYQINIDTVDKSINKNDYEEIEKIILEWKNQLTLNGISKFENKLYQENLTIDKFREILYSIINCKIDNSKINCKNFKLKDKEELGYLILFEHEILPVFSNLLEKLDDCKMYFEIDEQSLLNSFKIYILSTISKISENTIFHEYKTWEERYGITLNIFSKNLRSKHFKKYFISKYALLFRLVKDELERCLDFIYQILESLISDYLQIRKIVDFKIIKSIEFGLGDRHNLGKTVSLINFDENLKIIYKPYSLSTNQAYNNFVDFYINEKKSLKYKIKNPRIINKDNYGWQEFIEHTTTSNMNDLREYYYKIGVHLFLYYILNGNDLHFENTICHMNSPMIIDMETLLSPNTNLETKIDFKNVLQVGLLPFSVFTGENYFELGGLTDSKGVKSPFKKKIINLDKGKIVEEEQFFGKSKNLPYNEKINLLNYIDDIIDGFKTIFHIIMKEKDEIFEIVLKYFKQTKIRYIARDTMIYSHLLRESYHPFLLTYGFLLEKHFDWLWLQTFENPKLETIIQSEKNSLLNLDVPYFYTEFDSRDLKDFKGIVKKDFFKISSVDSIQKNISDINLSDLERQIWVIKASIITYINNQNN
ncbi:type 2 lanthipeptide synthetase LanM [Flavobacterium columnare]|uniref:type 2 lanthipeptide synthetase LanM n=1 Tax=Flavobacterium covae TaxID=2906076 RepID=UPI000B5BB511|nr:hypothetical protein B0A56_09135 [Flavobacterium columnare NBRC 100251 = ATCC 23463]